MAELGELSRGEGVDRRRFLQRAATVAWTTPLMMTVLADRAGAQQPCKQLTQSCSGTTAPCCAGLVCCSTGTPQVGTCRIQQGSPCTNDLECCNNCSGNEGSANRKCAGDD